MTPERLNYLKQEIEIAKRRVEKMIPVSVVDLQHLLEASLRLSAIENAGDEEVDRAYREMRAIIHNHGLPSHESAAALLRNVAKSRGLELAGLRAKLGEAEKALGNPSEIPNSWWRCRDERRSVD